MATPTLDDIRTRTLNAWLDAIHGRQDGYRAKMLHRLVVKLSTSSPPTPRTSEPGTTPEELAAIVAEETARAEATAQARAAQTAWLHEHEGGYRELGEATRDQWDQDD